MPTKKIPLPQTLKAATLVIIITVQKRLSRLLTWCKAMQPANTQIRCAKVGKASKQASNTEAIA